MEVLTAKSSLSGQPLVVVHWRYVGRDRVCLTSSQFPAVVVSEIGQGRERLDPERCFDGHRHQM